MTAVTVDTIRMVLRELLSDPVERAGLLGIQPFGVDQQDMLEKHESQLQSLLADSSLARVLSGPLWLSGTSVVNGSITAQKISVNTLEAVTTNTGNLNITGNLVAAAAFPATGARVQINSGGLWGFADGVNTTFRLNTDGSGEIGMGANRVTWTTGGVVNIPAAIIANLTIGHVGSGNLGGTYSTAATNPRIQLSPTMFVAFNSGGTETFRVDATTGAVTMTGSFTVQSATSGARVVISNAGGLEGFNASAVRTFFVNAAQGSGQLGTGSNNIAWDTGGNASIGGVMLSGGRITASHLSVATLSAISANLGTITAGTISGGTITASAITTGTLNFGSGGTVNTTGTVTGTFGGLNLANLTVTGNITLGSGGKIIDADGSEWGSSGINLKSSGLWGDTIWWTVSGVNKGSIYATVSDFRFSYPSGGMLFVGGADAGLQFGAGVRVGSILCDIELPTSPGTPRLRVLGGTTEKFSVTHQGQVRLVADATHGISTGWSSVSGSLATWAIYNVAGSLIGYIPVYSSRS